MSRARETVAFFYPDSSMDTDVKMRVTENSGRDMSVTISPMQAVRVALGILGQVIRHPRTNVTFEAWSDR